MYTLDSERLTDYFANDNKPVKLSLDGAATMIQSVGGFLVDLKYGERVHSGMTIPTVWLHTV